MSTITTTTSDPRERLRSLNDQIRSVHTDEAEATQELEAFVAELVDRHGSTEPQTQQERKRSAAFADRVRTARSKSRQLVEQAMSLLQGLEPGGRSISGPGLVLGFGTFELEELRATVARRQAGSIGFEAIAPSDFPMGTVPEFRTGDIWPFLRDTSRVADLFPMVATDARTVTVYRVSGAPSAAAAVAEGAVKPLSTPQWEAVEITLETIAHRVKITNQLAADFPGWRDAVGREAIGGLIEAENGEMVTGDGTSPNLLGILMTPGIGSVVRDTTNERRVEAIHRGITAVRTAAKVAPDGIVIHPNDLQDVRFEKTDTEGIYLAGDPLSSAPTNLWGVPLVVTEHVPEHTAIVGNFGLAGRVYVRQPVTLEVNPYGEDDWERNQTDVRCEERIALGIVRPEAICEVAEL